MPRQIQDWSSKTLLHRAYLICSTWEAFPNEVDRLKQLFIKNSYPIGIVDDIIKKFVDNKFNAKIPATNPNSDPKTAGTPETSPNHNSSTHMLKETRENFPSSFGGIITDNGRVVGDYVLESERVTKWKAVESENNTCDATDLIANSEDEPRHNKGLLILHLPITPPITR